MAENIGGNKLQQVDAHKNEFARFRAPYANAELTLIDQPDDDMPLMELRIREGRRITIVKLDRETVGEFAKALQGWADNTRNESA